MARISVDFNDKKLLGNLRTFDNRLKDAVKVTVDYNAGYATGWMKSNAPWTDRTGAARAGLIALPASGRNFEEIIMSYSVYYGIWLEVANNRRYAIIQPAMRIIGDKLMRDLQFIIDRMR